MSKLIESMLSDCKLVSESDEKRWEYLRKYFQSFYYRLAEEIGCKPSKCPAQGNGCFSCSWNDQGTRSCVRYRPELNKKITKEMIIGEISISSEWNFGEISLSSYNTVAILLKVAELKNEKHKINDLLEKAKENYIHNFIKELGLTPDNEKVRRQVRDALNKTSDYSAIKLIAEILNV